jgi:P2-related tail formation protein
LAAHLVQVPPQSAAVSVPFLTPSLQVAARQSWVVVEQTPLWQSPAALQILLVPHLGQSGPPQSMSVSLPFLATSEHVGSWQMLLRHTALVQSVPRVHDPPATHFGQLVPPQSTSVSLPFLASSVQVAAWHKRGVPVQIPL